jgi:hypothetical protein
LRALFGSIDETRTALVDLVRSAGRDAVITRPPTGEWSVLENVRHLLFAEQLHLGGLLPERPAWSRVGLTPDFFADREAFRDVGTQPSTDVEEVLKEWDRVHASMVGVPNSAADKARESLEGNLSHLKFHAALIEALLRERA